MLRRCRRPACRSLRRPCRGRGNSRRASRAPQLMLTATRYRNMTPSSSPTSLRSHTVIGSCTGPVLRAARDSLSWATCQPNSLVVRRGLLARMAWYTGPHASAEPAQGEAMRFFTVEMERLLWDVRASVTRGSADIPCSGFRWPCSLTMPSPGRNAPIRRSRLMTSTWAVRGAATTSPPGFLKWPS